MACWSTKAATSLKRVKIEEKLLRLGFKVAIDNLLLNENDDDDDCGGRIL